MDRPLLLLLSTAIAAAGAPGCSNAGPPRAGSSAAEPDPPAAAAAAAPGPSVDAFSGSSSGPAGSSLAAPSAARPSPPGAWLAGSAARTSDAAPGSGAAPRRPCTLRDWMKDNASPAILAGDFDALEAALDEVATFAPPGYPNWVSIARDGADAARVEDLEAVKAACRSCHAQYKDRYRRELHDRLL